MSIASRPSQFHGRRNRVWHFGSTGSCSSAAAQVLPASVLTSTRVTRPRPLQASPLISHHPRSGKVAGYAGDVMIDLASITKLNMRAVPLGSGSVYFAVSSRVMKGRSASSMRRIHFPVALPSPPGPGGRGAVPGALEEVEPGDRRKSPQCREVEDRGALDHAVDQELVAVRVDGGDAGVMALIVQVRRGDDAAQVLERRQ